MEIADRQMLRLEQTQIYYYFCSCGMFFGFVLLYIFLMKKSILVVDVSFFTFFFTIICIHIVWYTKKYE